MKNYTALFTWLTIVWTVVTFVADALYIIDLPWWAIFGPFLLMLALVVAIIINVNKL